MLITCEIYSLQGIVETVEWLEGNLKHYANQKLGMTFDVVPIRVSVEQYKKYKRGLEEITYNLQESQDFFDASLDGRLRTFHEIEAAMIEAQLNVILSLYIICHDEIYSVR